MTEIPREVGGSQAADPEVLQNLPKKHVMGPVHVAASLLMRGVHTYFEEGAKEDLRQHRENDGTLLILMTHFRRWEPIVMAEVSWVNEPLDNLPYNTGITARSDLFDMPVIGYIVRNSGSVRVDRVLENLNETPEQRAVRKEKNQKTQAVGGRFLANDGHWLIFPEGGSREVLYEGGKPVMKDGKPVKKPRAPDEVLPAQMGFVYSLKTMTPEERERVKLLGIAVHYGDRPLASLRATVTIPRLVTPLDGDFEDKGHRELVRQQGEDLLRRGVADAVRLDGLRG